MTDNLLFESPCYSKGTPLSPSFVKGFAARQPDTDNDSEVSIENSFSYIEDINHDLSVTSGSTDARAFASKLSQPNNLSTPAKSPQERPTLASASLKYKEELAAERNLTQALRKRIHDLETLLSEANEKTARSSDNLNDDYLYLLGTVENLSRRAGILLQENISLRAALDEPKEPAQSSAVGPAKPASRVAALREHWQNLAQPQVSASSAPKKATDPIKKENRKAASKQKQSPPRPKFLRG